MNKRRGVSGGHWTQAILLLGGIWLLIAPIWMGFSHDRLASRIDEWAGAAVIVASVASFVLQWAFGLRDLVHAHSSERSRQD